MQRVSSATRGLKHRAAPRRGWAVSGPRQNVRKWQRRGLPRRVGSGSGRQAKCDLGTGDGCCPSCLSEEELGAGQSR